MSRLVRVSENLLDFWGTRTEEGDRLTLKWGNPDAEGIYEPVIVRSFDDNLLDAYIERLRAKVERDFRWDQVARERAVALIEEARETPEGERG